MTTVFDGVAVDSNTADCSEHPVVNGWLAQRWKRLLMRIVWYAVWVACMTLNVYWMLLLTLKYLEFKPQTTLSLTYGPQPFPVVTLCPQTPMGKRAAEMVPEYAAIEVLQNVLPDSGAYSPYRAAMDAQAAKQPTLSPGESTTAGQTQAQTIPSGASQKCKEDCNAAGGFIYGTSCYVLNKDRSLSWNDAFCQCIVKPPAGFERTQIDGNMAAGRLAWTNDRGRYDKIWELLTNRSVNEAWVGLHKLTPNVNNADNLYWYLGPDEPGPQLTPGATQSPGFCCTPGDCVRPMPLYNLLEDGPCTGLAPYLCEFGCEPDDLQLANTSAPWAASECFDKPTTTSPPTTASPSPTTTAYDPCIFPGQPIACEAKKKFATTNDTMTRDAMGEDMKRSTLTDAALNDPNHGLQIEIMLKSCTYNGEICTKHDFAPINLATMGRCWQFNHDENKIRHATTAGMHHGLRMHLYVNQSDNLDSQTTSGFLLGIGDVGHTTFVDQSRLWVNTGLLTSIQLSMRSYSRLGKPYGSCMMADAKPYALKLANGDSLNYLYNDTYNVEACIRSFLSDNFYKTCNCSYPDFPSPPGVGPCDPNMKAQWDCYMNFWKLNYSSVNLGHTCLPECQINEYDYVITSTAWPANEQQLLSCNDEDGVTLPADRNIACFKAFRMNNLMAEVGFVTLTCDSVYESPDYPLLSLLSDYINIIGLCIGLSMINLVEVIYYAISFVFYCGRCIED